MYKYLDYVHVMCYDYHGKWDGLAGHNAPLGPRPGDEGNALTLNLEYTLAYLAKLGARPEKTILGVPLYGRAFTLQSAANHSMGAPTLKTAFQGPFTREDGFLGYNEICAERGAADGGWEVEWDESSQAPFMHRGVSWLSYDDERSIAIKSEYAFDQVKARHISVGLLVITWCFAEICGCDDLEYRHGRFPRRLRGRPLPSPAHHQPRPVQTGGGHLQRGGPGRARGRAGASTGCHNGCPYIVTACPAPPPVPTLPRSHSLQAILKTINSLTKVTIGQNRVPRNPNPILRGSRRRLLRHNASTSPPKQPNSVYWQLVSWCAFLSYTEHCLQIRDRPGRDTQ